MEALALARRPSLALVVAEKIREAIIGGDLGLGAALSEDKLASWLGVSRTPVREALTALQVQGLITILPQRGSFVFQPEDRDVAELCEFRLMAETRAMALAHARAREETLAALVSAQAAMRAAAQTGDDRASAAADAAFHEALFARCGNQFLVQSYGLISGRISAIRVKLLHLLPTRARSLDEHDEIIAAFTASDLCLAEVALAAHVMKMRPAYAQIAAAAAPPAGLRRSA